MTLPSRPARLSVLLLLALCASLLAALPATSADADVPEGAKPSDGTTPGLEQYRSSGTIPVSAVDLSAGVEFVLPG